jgi:hypothetical protein
LSFVYSAQKVANLGKNSLTEKEKDEGATVVWLPKLEALEKMKFSIDAMQASEYDSIYRTKFMTLRDIKILEYYINL